MTWARECEHCGGPIPDSRRDDAMYCSPECKRADYGAIVRRGRLEDKADRPPCRGCGALIPPEAPAHREFCTTACQRRAAYRAEIEARPAQTCPACGGTFHPTIAGQTWCSHACANRSIGKDGPRPCKGCGETMPSPRTTQKFCTPRCQKRWHRANRRERQ
jgi:hypothetical protein